MTLRRYRVRWWDSRDDDWHDITMLAQWESECSQYVEDTTPYEFRRRNFTGMYYEDSVEIFCLSEIVLPYVLTNE